MKIIYEPGGKAREYAPLAANLYIGCNHRCLYCYGPNQAHKKPEDFYNPLPRGGNILGKLEQDLQEMQATGDEREVLMSFLTDPYNSVDGELALTRDAFRLFIKYGRRFATLSKAGLKSIRDLDLISWFNYRDRFRYGTTLTLWGPEQAHWEPFAASTEERIRAITIAHNSKIRTFASIEPLINPAHSLDIIQATLEFVDEYRLGKLNHYRLPYEIDHAAYLQDAVAILERAGKPYIIKEDLRRAARWKR